MEAVASKEYMLCLLTVAAPDAAKNIPKSRHLSLNNHFGVQDPFSSRLMSCI